MKKALIVFILSYAVVFYFINEKYLAVSNPSSFIQSQGETIQVINARNDQMATLDTGSLNNQQVQISESNQRLNTYISNSYFYHKKKAKNLSKAPKALLVN